jgi:hypothetical protein
MTRVSGLISSLDFGNPAIPVGPVAFRPPIARSLALSVVMDDLSPLLPGQGHPLFNDFSANKGWNFRVISIENDYPFSVNIKKGVDLSGLTP